LTASAFVKKLSSAMARNTDKPVIAVYVRHYISPSETFIYRQLQGVRGRYRPVLLTANPSNLDLFPYEPLRFRRKRLAEKVFTRVARTVSRRSSWLSGGQRRFFAGALREENAKLVHAHFAHFALDMLPLARELGIPMLVTFHGVDASLLLENESYARALPALVDYAHTITVSQNMADRLAARGIRPRRLSVHYIGVPIEEFRYVERVPVRDKLAAGRPLRLLAVSNFIEVKGHRYTVQAFARYAKTRPGVELVLAGDGPLRAEIESLAAQVGVRDKVRFTGRVGVNRVIELMGKADAFLQHSVSLSNGRQEGLPTVLMEAMSTGLPVIATRHSGIPELVEDGVDGLLVEERDIDGYVSALERLPELDPGFGSRARLKIEQKFNMSVQNEKLMDIYRSAIDDGIV
jgi:glycosyltransferase involved in cell wall biosynthesis